MPLLLVEFARFAIDLPIETIELGCGIARLANGTAEANDLANFFWRAPGRLARDNAAQAVPDQAHFTAFFTKEFIDALRELRQVQMAVAEIDALLPAHSVVSLIAQKSQQWLVVSIAAGKAGDHHYRVAVSLGELAQPPPVKREGSGLQPGAWRIRKGS